MPTTHVSAVGLRTFAEVSTTIGDLVASTDTAPGTLPGRTGALLEALRPVVPYDAAWVALADSFGSDYSSLASVDLDGPVVDYLSGPSMAHDIEVTGTDRRNPPLSPSDLPYPAEELATWADCLVPAGIHEALAVALFTPDGRHVGFLALLSGGRTGPSGATRRHLAALAPLLAQGIDPMRSLLATGRLVRGATSGAALHTSGRTTSLPGLEGDLLLADDSPLLRVVHRRVGDERVWSSFLWPAGEGSPTEGFVQVTVIVAPPDAPSVLRGVVLLSPAPDLRGLTIRELEVLGLVVEGGSNQDIARTLFVTPRTVAAHVEHVLAKLQASTRTLAAVRAERAGLYLPGEAGR